MGNYQQPAGYGGKDGWDPNLANLEDIRRVDPEGYREIMEKGWQHKEGGKMPEQMHFIK